MCENLKNDRGDVLSAEELRNRLYSKFEEKGILDKLKSQLRNNIFSELSEASIISIHREQSKKKKSSPLLLQMINWLIADHLRIFEYSYTLSVFAAESRSLNEKEEIFTLSDVLRLLHVNPDSKTHRNLLLVSENDRDCSLLFYIFNYLGFRLNDDNSSKINMSNSTQTENFQMSATFSVQEKLQQIEDFYMLRKGVSRMEIDGNIETHLIKYKKSLEEKLKEDMKRDLQNFQDREILAMRMDEREKCRTEIDNHRRELESEYQAKLQSLVERERRAMQDNIVLKENLERETYNLRQDILGQLDQARQQELESRRLADKYRADFQVEVERIRKEKTALTSRENELNEKENSIQNLVHDLVAKERESEREEHAMKMRFLHENEVSLIQSKEILSSERAEVKRKSEEIQSITSTIDVLHDQLRAVKEKERFLTEENEKLRREVQRTMVYQSAAEELEKLKLELDAMHRTMQQTITERDSLRIQVESLQAQLQRPSPKMIALNRELEKVKDNHRLDQAIWSEQRNRLQTQMNLALDHNRSLNLKIDEQTEINNRLNRVVQSLKQEIQQSQFGFRMPSYYREPVVPNLTDTFFDTSLNATRLPPELELHGDTPTLHDDSIFYEEPRNRLIALEKEAEQLERRFSEANFKVYSLVPRGYLWDDVDRVDFQVQRKYNFQLDENFEPNVKIDALEITDLPSKIEQDEVGTLSMKNWKLSGPNIQNFSKHDSLEITDLPSKIERDEVGTLSMKNWKLNGPNIQNYSKNSSLEVIDPPSKIQQDEVGNLSMKNWKLSGPNIQNYSKTCSLINSEPNDDETDDVISEDEVESENERISSSPKRILDKSISMENDVAAINLDQLWEVKDETWNEDVESINSENYNEEFIDPQKNESAESIVDKSKTKISGDG